jgi:hypothetical protein
MTDPRAVITFDGVTSDNQARWTWTDFEPTAQDDFSIWLVNPELLQDMERARATAQADPQNGLEWLFLANRYRRLSVGLFNSPTIFSASYLPLGLEAYHKAAELLPDYPTPHIGLALLTLVPYMGDKNAPPEILQTVQDELQIARDLEQAHPELVNERNLTTTLLEDALYIYFYNDATATAETAIARDTATVRAAPAASLSVSSAAPSTHPTTTPSHVPTPSQRPALPASSALPTQASGDGLSKGQSVIILPIVVVAAIFILGYLILRSYLRRT